MCDSNMIELPRNPVDFKIDAVGFGTFSVLKEIRYGALATTPITDHIIVDELREGGFARLVRTEGEGPGIIYHVEATFDGRYAGERIRCGIYHHHKQLYHERHVKAREQEAIPGWAQF